MADESQHVNPVLEAIAAAFNKETDRAAVIVAAAMLDDALATLLKALLVNPASSGDSIVDGDQKPLGNFSARINAAHQLGLVSQYFARDLHLIRKIRNEFAHSAQDLSFAAPSVSGRVSALNASGFNRRFPAVRSGLGPAGPRGDFLGIASWMLFSLHQRLSTTSRLTAHPSEFGYFDVDAAIELVLDFEADPYGPSNADPF